MKPVPAPASRHVLPWADAGPRFQAPAFDAVRTPIMSLHEKAWPTTDALNALATQAAIQNRQGRVIRFVSPSDNGDGHQHYELRIAHGGEIATRDNWHDLFNAMQWLSFPQSKAMISELHAVMLNARGRDEHRSRSIERDVLTLFDESGIIVTSSDPFLLDLIRTFQWKTLFVERRAAVIRHMRFFLCGHALLEKMLNPYVGIVGKAVLFDVDENVSLETPARQQAEADRRAAAWLAELAAVKTTRVLQPLPLLGIPGWDARNEAADFYGNTHYFRAGYTRKPDRS
jgi:Protein of unknown function (DUF3025)